MGIDITFASGINDTIFGKCQLPVSMFLKKRGEQFEQQSVLKDLFCMKAGSSFGEQLSAMTAMDGFDPVGENGAYPNDGMQVGYEKMLIYMTWKDSFKISWEAMQDDKLLDLEKEPAQFLQAYHRTRELFGAALYGGAIQGLKKVRFRGKEFDISAADGSALFATNHKPKVKGGNQSNCFSNDFSVDALGMVETAMQNFKGDDDNELDVAPDTILIPNDASLKNAVFAAIGADKNPTNSNNAFNYQYGRWNVIVWPYLNRYMAAGTKPWILLDSRYNQQYGGAVWRDRTNLQVDSYEDKNNDANVWKGKSRFNATFNDFRFAAVGGVTGGTALT